MEISRQDQLILDIAVEEGFGCPCDVIVADDPTGALTSAAVGVLDEHPDARLAVLSRDRAQAEAAVTAAEARGLRERVRVAGIDGPLHAVEFVRALRGDGDFSAEFTLTRLPKSLAELDLLAAAAATGGMSLIGGGNTKHMTRSQNEVLARSFGDVHATRGQGKFRCLVAGSSLDPSADAGDVPDAPADPDARLWTTTRTPAGAVHGLGGVFGGASVDRGGQFLLDAALAGLAQGAGGPFTVLDLGCGNGSVSLALAAALPEARLLATDVEADAVVSAQRTLAPLGERAEVRWEDAAAGVADASVDVVLLNPPFHEGTRVDATLVEHLLDAARRVLRPGGHLFLVHNSHLRYRTEVERRFRGVEQAARNSMFTVLHARG